MNKLGIEMNIKTRLRTVCVLNALAVIVCFMSPEQTDAADPRTIQVKPGLSDCGAFINDEIRASDKEKGGLFEFLPGLHILKTTVNLDDCEKFTFRGTARAICEIEARFDTAGLSAFRGSNASSITFENLTFQNRKGSQHYKAIELVSSNWTVIQFCGFSNRLSAITMVQEAGNSSSVDNTWIDRNEFRAAGGEGRKPAIVLKGSNFNKTLITRNAFLQNYAGIDAKLGSHLVIRNNLFNNVQDAAVLIDESFTCVTIDGNNFEKNKVSVLLRSSSRGEILRATVTNNKMKGCRASEFRAECGVRIQGTVDGIVISQNLIEDYVKGVEISGSARNVTMRDNTLLNLSKP